MHWIRMVQMRPNHHENNLDTIDAPSLTNRQPESLLCNETRHDYYYTLSLNCTIGPSRIATNAS
jgi:hypothetical protein